MARLESVARRVRAWIETSIEVIKIENFLSHAVCVRGLKPEFSLEEQKEIKSHAVCVRGLKQRYNSDIFDQQKVARRVRAWIETSDCGQQ